MTQQTTSCSQSKVTCSPRLPLCEQGWEPGLWECCQKGRGPWLFLLGLPSPTPWPFPKSPGAPAEGQSPRASDQLGPEETKGRHPSTASWRRAWARAPLGRRVSCFLLQVPLTCPPLHPPPPASAPGWPPARGRGRAAVGGADQRPGETGLPPRRAAVPGLFSCEKTRGTKGTESTCVSVTVDSCPSHGPVRAPTVTKTLSPQTGDPERPWGPQGLGRAGLGTPTRTHLAGAGRSGRVRHSAWCCGTCCHRTRRG